jgi:hypothetical protein
MHAMVEVPRTAAQRKYWPEWDLHLQRTNPPMTKKKYPSPAWDEAEFSTKSLHCQ